MIVTLSPAMICQIKYENDWLEEDECFKMALSCSATGRACEETKFGCLVRSKVRAEA